MSLTCRVAFIDSEGMTSVWPMIVFSYKNWPAKDPAQNIDNTIPATTNTPPAIRII